MSDDKRIVSDIELFSKNIKELESIKIPDGEKKVVDMARDYAKDTEYYLEKKDLMTAFGCIAYAHGLLDAIRLIHGII